MHSELIKQNIRTSEEVQNIDKGKNNACCSKVFGVIPSFDAILDCSTSSPFSLSYIFHFHLKFHYLHTIFLIFHQSQGTE